MTDEMQVQDFPRSKADFEVLSEENKPETTVLSSLRSASESRLLHPVMQQLLLSKEEMFPEQQELNMIVDQKDIKEEQEEHWTSQEGQQLHQLEEADITKLPFTVVLLKDENVEEKPQLLQVHQSRTEENTEAESLTNSLTAHRTLMAKDDGEDNRGPQPGSKLSPYSYLQPDTKGSRSDSSETETNSNCEGKHIRELSSFSCLKNSDMSVGDNRGNSSGCGKAVGHVKFSEQHRRIQTSEKHVGFPECNKRRRRKGCRTPKRSHTGGKIFSCFECGKKFKDKSEVNIHMRIHTGEKPFDCSECGKRFRVKSILNTHMRIHTGDQPFGCFVCDKRFRQKCHLDCHVKIHKGEKSFDCSVCGKRFRRKCDVNTHMNIHAEDPPFGCSECDKRFSHKCHLDIHMRIHKGEKPFGCSECGKRFGEKGNLNRHIRIHSGEKPFCCSVCSKKFGDKSTLNRHTRIHTEEKQFDFKT